MGSLGIFMPSMAVYLPFIEYSLNIHVEFHSPLSIADLLYSDLIKYPSYIYIYIRI